MTGRQPRIWVLLGHRTGDNNHLLALAEALQLPFETRTLRFNLLRALHPWLGASRLSLSRASRGHLRPPWPDLVLGIGWRSAPVARWIKQASGGKTRLVRLGDPRLPPELFDLLITTPQYPVGDAPNVLRLPIGMSRYRAAHVAADDEREIVESLPRPHLLFAVGGSAKYWQVTTDLVLRAAHELAERAAALGGSLVLVTSPRTPEAITSGLRGFAAEADRCCLVEGQRPRFAVLLADADEIFVTGDSVAMTSEAVLSGKPVGIVEVELDARGRRALGEGSARHRDLRRFWSGLRERGLAGTVDEPLAGQIDDPAATAANAVRALLGDGVE